MTLALIGGTGLYDLQGLDIEARLTEGTPYGAPLEAFVKPAEGSLLRG